MNRVVAIVGSYRRGGITDSAVNAVLDGARRAGMETEKIYLLDQRIGFCDNCRACAQKDGVERGKCRQSDDLELVLQRVESAAAVVLAAPVNCFNVTAIFRQFIERLLGYMYWPWGSNLGPVLRSKEQPRKAVLITSAAMPARLIPLATGAPRALRTTARILGARDVGHLWIGPVPADPRPVLQPQIRQRAEKLGARLA